MSQYLTQKDVANKLKVSVNTVRRWQRAGKIKALRVDDETRTVRYNKHEIDNLLK